MILQIQDADQEWQVVREVVAQVDMTQLVRLETRHLEAHHKAMQVEIVFQPRRFMAAAAAVQVKQEIQMAMDLVVMEFQTQSQGRQ
jgi:hypothetical protein